MSEPIVGRKIHTVGKAPAAVIRWMPAIVFSIGSIPAMISPETAPRECATARDRSGG